MERIPDLKPALNLDVLLNIMSKCNARTISRLMRASREFYPEGPKLLLRQPVKLKRGSSVSSFVAFMRAEHPQRFQYLRTLEVSSGRLSRSQANALEDFLIDCEPYLIIRKLTIDNAEEFFASSPELAGAFSLLRHVKHLAISEIGKRANSFLTRLQSSLVTADLTMIPLPFDDNQSSASDDDEDEDDNDDFRNPIKQLHNSQATLESLSVAYCDTFSDTAELYEECYPSVTELTLMANELPTSMHYARAFPNVQTLTLECDQREYDQLGTNFLDFHALRVMNETLLQREQRWTTTPLKAVHGPLIDQYLLGLVCPVEQLHIGGNYMDKRMFRSVLLATRPAYVNFQHFDVDIFADGEFRRLMRGHFLATVRCFEITIVFGGMLEPEQVDVPEALDALIEGIGKMPSVRSFGLTLCGFALQPGIVDMLISPNRTSPLCPAEEYLRDLDLDALALRIRREVPSLQTVAVSLIGHRARPNAFATLGEDVAYEEGAVETIPLRHASRVTLFDPAKKFKHLPMLL